MPDFPLPILSNSPAEHTNEKIARSAEAVLNSLFRAMFSQPEPDVDAINAAFVAECQSVPDDVLAEIGAGFAEFRDGFAGEAETMAYSVDGVERTDDDEVWVTVSLIVDGTLVIGTELFLHAFEDGQWRHVECIDT